MLFIATYLAIFLTILGLAQAVPGKNKGGFPKDIDMDTHILFGWCREWNSPEDCGQRKLEHARCYNFKDLDAYLNDNVETITVKDGRCVIWNKDNCHGDHTGMIVGNNVFANNLCPRYDWQRKASSVKCCGGDPNAMWCANPGKVPKCTD